MSINQFLNVAFFEQKEFLLRFYLYKDSLYIFICNSKLISKCLFKRGTYRQNLKFVIEVVCSILIIFSSFGKENIFFGIFVSVPGKRYRFWPVPGPRNCVDLHSFTNIIHVCCNHVTPSVYLKQVYTQKNLIYNCNTI